MFTVCMTDILLILLHRHSNANSSGFIANNTKYFRLQNRFAELSSVIMTPLPHTQIYRQARYLLTTLNESVDSLISFKHLSISRSHL